MFLFYEGFYNFSIEFRDCERHQNIILEISQKVKTLSKIAGPVSTAFYFDILKLKIAEKMLLPLKIKVQCSSKTLANKMANLWWCIDQVIVWVITFPYKNRKSCESISFQHISIRL